MSEKLTKDALGAIALILMTRSGGIDAVDACRVIENAQAANQLARAAGDEANRLNDAAEAWSYRMPSGWVVPRTNAFLLLKTGWLPEGWQS